MAEEEKETRPEEGHKEAEVEESAQAEEGGAEKAPPAAEEKKVELTEKELKDLLRKAEERDDYLDILLRTKADFQNYQKRVKKEFESLGRFAAQDIVQALLPVLDNFSRAIKSVGKTNSEGFGKFLHGIEIIRNQFLSALEGFGIKTIHVQEGQAFNPEFHEAFLEEEHNELPHHTILEEIEPGFLLYDRVLKPAKVKVSKRTVTEEKPSEEKVAEKVSEGSTQEGKSPKEKPLAEASSEEVATHGEEGLEGTKE